MKYNIGDVVKVKDPRFAFKGKFAIAMIIEKEVVLEEATRYIVCIAGMEGKILPMNEYEIVEKI